MLSIPCLFAYPCPFLYHVPVYVTVLVCVAVPVSVPVHVSFYTARGIFMSDMAIILSIPKAHGLWLGKIKKLSY
jgi:hypothetical protein